MREELTLDQYRALTKRPARSRPTEAQEQAALIQWRDVCVGQEPRLKWLYHTPNGGIRDKATAGQMRAAGVARGVPDLLMPVPARDYVGWACELKAERGIVSPEQEAWLAHLRLSGWHATVYRGWVAAALSICWYLGIDSAVLGLISRPQDPPSAGGRVFDRAHGTSPHSASQEDA